jgi:hypothetical protein
MMEEVTHKQIYERLVAVETKVDAIDQNTKGMVAAFDAAAGAFVVLDFLGKLAKPILFIGGAATAIAIFWQDFWKK